MSLLKFFQDSSSLNGGNASFIENLYERFLEDPESVEPGWREQFREIHNGANYEIPHSPIVERFGQLALKPQSRIAQLQGFTEESVKKQSAVARLINHYRVRGHQIANNNPLGRDLSPPTDMDPAYYGLSELDMDTLFDTGASMEPIDCLYGILSAVYGKFIAVVLALSICISSIRILDAG